MSTRLGQNFLINKEIVKKIIQSTNLKSDDLVLEIGPGKGILTEELAKYAGKVVAVEIDGKLVNLLKDKLKSQKNIEIVEGDILKIFNQFSISKFSNFKKVTDTKYQIPDAKYKVIANLPYYITSPVIRKFLEAEFPPSEMILMVQKEVAERIVAEPSKMSILAVSVQYYAKPEILFYVERKNFEPVPEVDSAVIRITQNVERETQKNDETKKFFRIVRAGFCAKRKTLANNLANSFHLDKKVVEEKLKATRIKPIARAQELSVEEWKKLAEIFKEK